jgi:cobyrinic acid a,c-diamide synthase
MSGAIIAAPSSGCGKTIVTLGILRALRRRGVAARGAKSGPDYIDPRFHEIACSATCFNLDAWAMTPDRLRALASGAGPLIVEGAMGLFDGAPPDGRGATADLARLLGFPVILVIDAARMAQSVAPLALGFARHDPEVRVAGVILNNVGSDRHDRMLRRSLDRCDIIVLGMLRRSATLTHPSRHLGLVQAQERDDLEGFLDAAADLVESGIDLDALLTLAATAPSPRAAGHPRMTPPAQRIAVAQDAAFAFAYPHLLADWRAAGSEISFFSPLANDLVPNADLIFLPGGYPELHAARIAAADRFMHSLQLASQGTDIYGECGGYMVLGDSLVDSQGKGHRMAGLIRLETSFARRKLHLGYRNVSAQGGPFAGTWAAHEFHYATTLSVTGSPLFAATDAEGAPLAPMGLCAGRVSGSFAHLIDRR